MYPSLNTLVMGALDMGNKSNFGRPVVIPNRLSFRAERGILTVSVERLAWCGRGAGTGAHHPQSSSPDSSGCGPRNDYPSVLYRAGILRLNVLPSPGVDVTSIRPPSNRARQLEL